MKEKFRKKNDFFEKNMAGLGAAVPGDGGV
jgi:hypothetical protein